MKIQLALTHVFTPNFLFQISNSILYHIDLLLPYDVTQYINFDLPINYDTIENLILISQNAYMTPDNDNWNKIEYNNSDVSVSPNDIRAYLFSDTTQTLNIVAIKGTTLSLLSNNTASNDKFNDNLFFSCCFYKESKLFDEYYNNHPQQYDCLKKNFETSLLIDKNYLNMLNIIIDNIKKYIDFNKSNVYFTGHSLGGFIASVLGIKYNKQAIVFNSPGSKHYLDLSGIKYDDSRIYNFGHNADSIMNGQCKLCKLAGYHIKTACHIGHSCIYDAKTKLGLTTSLLTHPLNYIIKSILPNWKTDFPKCIYHKLCEDLNCKKWNFI